MKHRVQMTLAEQMHLHDLEICNRKRLLGFGEEDVANLRVFGNLLAGVIDDIVDEFYERQLEVDEIALIIGDADTLSRLRAAQHDYIVDLFTSDYGPDYVNNRLRIGQVHKRIGVEPKHYLSAMAVLKRVLSRHVRILLPAPADHQPVEEALEKLLNFDTQLVIDTYIRSLLSEVESAKSGVERYAQTLEDQVAERTRELKDLSEQDPLTGLFNRRALDGVLARDMANAERQNRPLSFLFIDVDGFKDINDRHGHTMGDNLLRRLGGLMKEISRDGDFPCRMGGDEFGLVLPNTDELAAENLARRLMESLGGEADGFSCSIGVAACGNGRYETPQEMVKRADWAMYAAKARDGFAVVRASTLQASPPVPGGPSLRSV